MIKSKYIEGLGSRLENLRFERDMSCPDVAKKVGFDPIQIYRYESGFSNPLAPNLITLANFYKVSTDYLLGLSNNRINIGNSEFDQFAKEIIRLSDEQKNLLLEFLKTMK